MKNQLFTVLVPSKMLFLTRNILDIACLNEQNGKVCIKGKDLKRIPAPHPCYSVSKSTVSLALGFLYDQGLFRLEDKIADYLGEYFLPDTDKKWYDVTINHLLHHKTGMQSETEFDGMVSDFDLDQSDIAWQKNDLIYSVFALPIIHTPGEKFVYCDLNYYILARLVEKLSSQDPLTLLTEKLFIPLHFINYTWVKDSLGHVLGGTGLMVRTEDYAKLGWLWLHKGTYEGVRYISEEWMTKGLTMSVSRENGAHYGFGVRRLSKFGYSITGARGQGLYFNINKNFVVCWHARGKNQIMTLCEVLDKLNILK